MLMISIMFTAVKWLGEHGVHLMEMLFFRQLFALPVAVGALMLGPGLTSLRTKRIGAHAGRTAVGSIGMALNFSSFMLLPLAEATTIGFTVPIFATILAIIFLSERPGFHRWSAIIVGFIGVLVIIGPNDHSTAPPIGFAIAIAAAIVTSSVSLLLRQLGKTEPTAAIVFYFSALSLPPLAIAMLFFGQAHEPFIWLIIIGMGVAGGIAQLLMTASLKWAPVSLVLPMDYSTLLWSTLFGWILWASWPGSWTWVGAIIIATSSLYIAWREHRHHRVINNRSVSIS